MAEYRVYAIDGDGHIVKSISLICDDDSQAVQEAREFREGHTLDIWSGPARYRTLGYLVMAGQTARSAFAEFFRRHRK